MTMNRCKAVDGSSMRKRARSSALLLGACSLLLLSANGVLAGSAYRLRPGDVVEVSVVGTPDLKTRAMIDNEGSLTVPLIPQVEVSGLTVDAARELVAARLSHKIFQQRAADGRDATVAIAPNTVLLIIAEYRPIYLNGDVTRPGQQTYRPGLTVAQAVALAGGYEIMRFRMNNPFIEMADLRRDYQTRWLELATAYAAIWRLRSELHEDQPSLEEVTQAPLPDNLLGEVRRNARRQLAAALDRQQAELGFLKKAADTSGAEASILRTRQAKEDESTANDRAEFATLQGFSNNGNLPIMRLAEVRRLYLLSETQSLQTSVSLNVVSREQADYLRRQERLIEDRRADILKNLDAEALKRDSARAGLAAISEKITYTGMIRSQLTREDGSGPKIYIIHPSIDGGGRDEASETTEVAPGDTLDIRLRAEAPDQLSMK